MKKYSPKLVEDLKADGLYFSAGMVAFSVNQPRLYGCHYGMRSDLEQSRHAFYVGWDAAAAEAASKGE